MSAPNDGAPLPESADNFSTLPMQDDITSSFQPPMPMPMQMPMHPMASQPHYPAQPPGFVPTEYAPNTMAQQYNQQMMYMMQQQQQQQHQMMMMMAMTHSSRQMQEQPLPSPVFFGYNDPRSPSASRMRYHVDAPQLDDVSRPPVPSHNTMFDATPAVLMNRPLDFTSTKFHDIGYMISYIFHFLGLFIILAAYTKKGIKIMKSNDNGESEKESQHPKMIDLDDIVDFAYRNSQNNSTDTGNNNSTPLIQITFQEFGMCIIILVVSCFTAIVISFLFLKLLKAHSSVFMNSVIFSSIITGGFTAAFFFVYDIRPISLISMMFTIVAIGFFVTSRSQVPFAGHIISWASDAVLRFPKITVYMLTILCLEVLWVCLWIYVCLLLIASDKNLFLKVYIIFSIYWTSQIFKNALHVCVAGIIGHWYFSDEVSLNVVLQKPWKRALMYSFGSVCHGSLLVGIMSTLHLIFYVLTNEHGGMGAFFCKPCLNTVESITEKFNKYAFVHIAFYAAPYRTAAVESYRLLRMSGLYDIANDSMVDFSLTLTCYLAAMYCALTSYIMGSNILENHTLIVYIVIISFIAGFFIYSILTGLIESCVLALFVCSAENPERSQQLFPIIWEQIYNHPKFPQA